MTAMAGMSPLERQIQKKRKEQFIAEQSAIGAANERSALKEILGDMKSDPDRDPEQVKRLESGVSKLDDIRKAAIAEALEDAKDVKELESIAPDTGRGKIGAPVDYRQVADANRADELQRKLEGSRARLERLNLPYEAGRLTGKIAQRRRVMQARAKAAAAGYKLARLERLALAGERARVREERALASQARSEARLARQQRLGFITAGRQRKIIRLQTKQMLTSFEKPVSVKQHERGIPGRPRRTRKATIITVTSISGARARSSARVGPPKRRRRRKGRRKR